MAACRSAPLASDWRTCLDAAIDARRDDLIRARRHLHAQPELSGAEHETTRFIAERVRSLSLEPRLGRDGRGVVVDAPAAAEAGRVALRADIDALPIQEQNALDYRSQRPGCMHACGHDAHTAVVWGALVGLKAVADAGLLPWPVHWRAIFQPAEETLVGAAEMIDQGCLDGVAAILGVHVDPSRHVGRIGVRGGAFTANCDSLEMRIIGRGGHAARPHDTIDPIAAAAQLITAIYTLVPRAVESQDPVVVSIGMIHGGQTHNVIPEEVLLKGTVRTLDRTVRTTAHEQIRRIAAGIASASGARIEVTLDEKIGGVCNDASVNELLRVAAGDVVGQERVEEIPRPSMGSEDFAAYLDYVPGAMFRLGCATPAVGNAALHTPTFYVDEQALAVGAKILARAAVLWSDPQRRSRPR